MRETWTIKKTNIALTSECELSPCVVIVFADRTRAPTGASPSLHRLRADVGRAMSLSSRMHIFKQTSNRLPSAKDLNRSLGYSQFSHAKAVA
jgi:hypothetical protein